MRKEAPGIVLVVCSLKAIAHCCHVNGFLVEFLVGFACKQNERVATCCFHKTLLKELCIVVNKHRE
jgi:hypothetical protein